MAGKLGNLQGKIDPELLTRLQFIAGSTKEKTGKEKGESPTVRYDQHGADTGVYSGKGGTPDNYHASGAKGAEYGPMSAYTKKKKRDLYEK